VQFPVAVGRLDGGVKLKGLHGIGTAERRHGRDDPAGELVRAGTEPVDPVPDLSKGACFRPVALVRLARWFVPGRGEQRADCDKVRLGVLSGRLIQDRLRAVNRRLGIGNRRVDTAQLVVRCCAGSVCRADPTPQLLKFFCQLVSVTEASMSVACSACSSSIRLAADW
jgi:hypothetical protein